MAKPRAEWNQPIIDEFRASAGTVTARGYRRNLVLVHNIGAKTGAKRIAPVLAVQESPDAWIIAAARGARESGLASQSPCPPRRGYRSSRRGLDPRARRGTRGRGAGAHVGAVRAVRRT